MISVKGNQKGMIAADYIFCWSWITVAVAIMAFYVFV